MNLSKRSREKIIIAVAAVFIMGLFGYITYLTPLAGDDWGYAVMGRYDNPFIQAYRQYFSWSGRFFSELWGFVVAPNKWLWNILNPLMFTSIFINVIRLFKNNRLLISVLTIGLMLSIPNTLRIETYTWIMGSTYVVPLALCLFYLNIVKPIVLEDKLFNKPVFILCAFINFYITLCMENIAVGLVLLNILLLIYVYFYKKALIKKFIVLLLISIIGVIILRISPGSTYRLYRDNLEWTHLSIFEQISINWLSFLDLTFVSNNYLIFTLSLSLILFNYKNNRQNFILKSMIYFAGLIISMSSLIYSKTELNFLKIFFDVYYTGISGYLLTGYYFIYIVNIFISLRSLEDKKFYEGITYLMVGGTCNMVMLLSPIFGARSSLYTVYFIILLICFIIADLKIDKRIYYGLTMLYLALIALKTKEYLYKYRLVDYYMQIRYGQIEYYVNNPEVEEAWIIRMPANFIHSADIEEWDTNHMEAFKEYYGINQDMKIIFYKEK